MCKKPVSADAKIDKGGLDAGLQIDDFATVDIARKRLDAVAFDIQLFQPIALQDRDAALFGLETFINIAFFI